MAKQRSDGDDGQEWGVERRRARPSLVSVMEGGKSLVVCMNPSRGCNLEEDVG